MSTAPALAVVYVRVPVAVYAQLKDAAWRNRLSLAAHVRHVLDASLVADDPSA